MLKLAYEYSNGSICILNGKRRCMRRDALVHATRCNARQQIKDVKNVFPKRHILVTSFQKMGL
jgi:hypothetical protein